MHRDAQIAIVTLARKICRIRIIIEYFVCVETEFAICVKFDENTSISARSSEKRDSPLMLSFNELRIKRYLHEKVV